jgi:TfoX/Sxy family transcriptional regulator of competence genes
MAYDEDLARRIRKILAAESSLTERKMFGGVGFMLNGNMACGVNGDDLIVRTGPKNYQSALDLPYTHEFDMTGRPMTGWVVVSAQGVESDQDLDKWVKRGVGFAKSLPAK